MNDDGTIRILYCPAHTRGEQAVAIRLKNTGTIVLPAGVLPQRVNLDQEIITGTPRAGPERCLSSMRKLKRIIEREKASVIFHHDPEQWKNLRLAPAYFD